LSNGIQKIASASSFVKKPKRFWVVVVK